jgi:ferredoxin
MTFNSSAQSLIKHGHARPMDAAEGLDLLALAHERQLVQFGSNVRERVNFICNCCGCCCEAMIAARRFGHLHPVHTTSYIPEVRGSGCTGCSRCVSACPVEAMGLVSANDPQSPERKKAQHQASLCLGCGVCVRACPKGAITLTQREERVIPPLNTTHLAVVMAIERGKLQELIFDNQVLTSHRVMAAILGAILKLPPARQAMASQQVKSRYVEALIRRFRP